MPRFRGTDAPLIVAPAAQLACPASTHFVVTGSVEGANTWLVCCEPKPAALGAHERLLEWVEEGLYERWFEDGRLEETSMAHAGQTSGQRRT